MISIESGNSVTLEVEATSSGSIAYQWYTSITTPSHDILEGETSNKLLIGATGHFRCHVSDSLGGSVDIHFNVTVDNDLSAIAEQNKLFDYYEDENVELKVSASGKRGSFHYEWYKMNDLSYFGNRFGSYGYNKEPIQGADNSSLTTKRNSSYCCTVKDDYGNSKDVVFFADTHTNIDPEGDQELIVELGSTVTLKVKAESPNNVFSYQWTAERTSDGRHDIIDNETADTLVITDIQQSRSYYCIIRNGYNEKYNIKFNVVIGDTHTEVVDAGFPATCTKEGLSDGKHCSFCGKVLVEQVKIEPLGHDWDEGKVVKEPTYTENGIRIYTCKRCGETKTEDSSIKIHLGSIGWVQNSDGSWSYGDANGDAVVGPMNYNGTMYCFNEQGRMIIGWGKVEGKWYYAESSGALAYGGWRQVGGTWYYFRAGGEMATGWVNDNGIWYHMNARGEIETGWIKDKNNWYYFNKDGSMYIGWLKDGNSWYRLKADGTMVTGWNNDGGTWYYFKKNGSMQKFVG